MNPYREGPQMLMCPRCADVLDRVFAGVSTCMRCRGMWINQGALDSAFGNPRWPVGQTMWWHQELECPECATEGQTTKMDARQAGNVMVDVCPSHGLWLDHGELGRLMGLPAGTDELRELQKRLHAVGADPEEVAQRRIAWRSELEARRRAAQEFRSSVEAEQRKRAKEVAAREAEERAKRRSEALLAQQEAKLRARQAAEKRHAVEEAQEKIVQVKHEIRTLEAELTAKREEANALENRLDALYKQVTELAIKITSDS